VVAVDDAALGTAIAPEWIVCKASARSVVDGVVVCPSGIFSPWAHCLGCRFLEGAEDDRDAARSCSVEPTAAPAEAQPESPTSAWAELIIELL
jgi:hypothetical protein